jgi:hypothetical protein
MHIGQLQPHTRRPLDPEQPFGVADMYQRQRAVVFVVSRVEGPRQRELLEPRHHACRSDLALRRDQRDLFAQTHTERPRKFAAQNNSELAILQGGQRLPPHQRGDVRHRRLRAGFDTADQDTAHRIATRQQGLGVDVGRGADDLRVAARLALDLTPVDRVAESKYLDVRDHRQHAVTHLRHKAVHHRKHDDQGHHAERDAQHRNARDEGDKAVATTCAPSGARVAQPDAEFVGKIQGSVQPNPIDCIQAAHCAGPVSLEAVAPRP